MGEVDETSDAGTETARLGTFDPDSLVVSRVEQLQAIKPSKRTKMVGIFFTGSR
jgi:hypothetical protein